MVSRLDKHRSDIQVDLRNEGTQIQRAIETCLNTQLNEFESKLNAKFTKQGKQLVVIVAIIIFGYVLALSLKVMQYM